MTGRRAELFERKDVPARQYSVDRKAASRFHRPLPLLYLRCTIFFFLLFLLFFAAHQQGRRRRRQHGKKWGVPPGSAAYRPDGDDRFSSPSRSFFSFLFSFLSLFFVIIIIHTAMRATWRVIKCVLPSSMQNFKGNSLNVVKNHFGGIYKTLFRFLVTIEAHFTD